MKKFIYIIAILLIGNLGYAVTVENQVTNTNIAPQETAKPEYSVETKYNKNIYYDKYGKILAHDKTINNQTFFYNKVGQLVGKSVTKNEKTYYYNQIGTFLGVCDETGCQDKEFNSTGKIPPLPQIKHFQPIYDNNILNPAPKTTDEEE